MVPHPKTARPSSPSPRWPEASLRELYQCVIPASGRAFVSNVFASSLRVRFLTGAGWSLVGAVASQGLSLATFVICARTLGVSGYGQLGMILSTVIMFGVFVGLAFGTTATKYVAEFRSRDVERTGGIIAIVSAISFLSISVLSAALVLLAPLISSRALNAPRLSSEMQIAAVLLFFNGLNGTQAGVLSGFEAFRTLAQLNTARGALSLFITAATVVAWKLPGAVLGLAIGAGAGCVMNQIAISHECSKRQVKTSLRAGWRDRWTLCSFSLSALLTSGISVPTIWAVSAMLARQKGGFAELGLFSAAWQWGNAIGFVPYYLCQPLLSVLTNHRACGEVRSMKGILSKTLGVVTCFSVAGALAVIAASKWIILAYGRSFAAGRPVLVIMALASICTPLTLIVNQFLASLSRMWYAALFSALWAGLYVGMSWTLVPRFGALGMVSALFGAYLVTSVGSEAREGSLSDHADPNVDPRGMVSGK